MQLKGISSKVLKVSGGHVIHSGVPGYFGVHIIYPSPPEPNGPPFGDAKVNEIKNSRHKVTTQVVSFGAGVASWWLFLRLEWDRWWWWSWHREYCQYA